MSQTAGRKAPAFQLYADDFLAGTMDMTDEEVGIYIKLLCLQWTKGAIGPRQMRAASANVDTVKAVIAEKFTADTDGNYRNGRLEEVRRAADEYSDRMTARGLAGANARWNKQSDAQAMPKQCLSNAKGDAKSMLADGSPTPSPSPSPTPSSSPVPSPTPVSSKPSASAEGSSEPVNRQSEPPSEISPESQAVSPESVKYPSFPTIAGRKRGPAVWTLTDEVRTRLGEAYPAVDVERESRKAFAWVMANRTRRKTFDGMEDFLRRWCEKAQNQSRPQMSTPKTYAQQREENTIRAAMNFQAPTMEAIDGRKK